MRRRILTIVLVVSSVFSVEAVTYATKRIASLAAYLHLQQLDTLHQGENDAYTFRQHPLCIRVNRWNEIEHIGLKLIPKDIRADNPLLYDFLERNLLERNVVPGASETGFLLTWEKLHFNIGTAATALEIDSTMFFYEDRVDYRVYRCGWRVDDKKLLELSFVMDYQMLTGCNLIELEENFVKEMRRHEIQPNVVTYPAFEDADSLATQYTLHGTSFLIPQINNDLYYKRTDTGWQLINDSTMPSKTIPNMMLAPADTIPLHLLVARYGFRTDTVETTYNKWIDLCVTPGSDVYYGMKSKVGDVYTGTVFILNHKGGYMQLLSVQIPSGMLARSGKDVITGRMHGFIPLHHVNKQMLENIGYEKKVCNEKELQVTDALCDDDDDSHGDDSSDCGAEETIDIQYQKEP